jgi:hypothetical protein
LDHQNTKSASNIRLIKQKRKKMPNQMTLNQEQQDKEIIEDLKQRNTELESQS